MLAISTSLLVMSPATAAPKATSVTAAFKSLLSTATNSIDELDQKYESDVSALDDALSTATKAADALLKQEQDKAEKRHLKKQKTE